jgi:hypothetical protein
VPLSDATARVGTRSSTRASTIRTFAAFIDTRVGKSPSKHSGNGRPPPTEVTMYDSPYDSEEEVDAWFAQEVAIEHEDFVDEILEESYRYIGYHIIRSRFDLTHAGSL